MCGDGKKIPKKKRKKKKQAFISPRKRKGEDHDAPG